MAYKHFRPLVVSVGFALIIAAFVQLAVLPVGDSEYHMYISNAVSVEIPTGVIEGTPARLRVTDHNLEAAVAHFDIDNLGDYRYDSDVQATIEGHNHAFDIWVTPKGAGNVVLRFDLLGKDGSHLFSDLAVAHAAASPFHRVRFFAFVFIAGFALIFSSLLLAKRLSKSRQQQLQKVEAKIEQAEIKAEKEPEKAKFAWDLARVKLEAYFDRNLLQVNQVFVVAIIVMCVGFAFVLAGVVLSLKQPTWTPTSLVAGISGIITQFIGATFMVIYRSTMAQANEFMTVLERINSVGMAVQVLDSIPESEPKLKNETRAQIVELLLSVNVKSRPKSDTTRKKAKAAEAG
jgi:hypothetical protein